MQARLALTVLGAAGAIASGCGGAGGRDQGTRSGEAARTGPAPPPMTSTERTAYGKCLEVARKSTDPASREHLMRICKKVRR